MTIAPRALLLAPTLLLTACLDPGGTLGELANGGFHYECVAYGDPVCDGPTGSGLFDDFIGQPSNTPVPSSFAVGAVFDIEFYENDGGDETAQIRRAVTSASPLLLDETASGFVALRPGWVALLARDGRGEVADFVHVRVAEPTGLLLSGYIGDTMSVGQRRDLYVEIYDRDRNQLGGALRYEWEVDDPEVAALLPAFDLNTTALSDDHVLLEALSPGATRVRVMSEGLEVAVDVVVTGAGGSE